MENKIQEKIYSQFGVEAKREKQRRMWLKIDQERLLDLLRFLNVLGFEELSGLSALDWPKQEKMELVYHLWSYQEKMLLSVKTMIARESPGIDSVVSIWGASAQIQEREIHELFGIDFPGNPDLSELFLEDYSGPPPFLKDFNWRKHYE